MTSGAWRYSEKMFGPRTRISSLPPLGSSFSSIPGKGRPMQPARSMRQCTLVTAGAVSVAPQDEVNHSGRLRTLATTASSRAHRLCGSAAPA